jgi:glycosyltransferase involved in cell wall biosynthesis
MRAGRPNPASLVRLWSTLRSLRPTILQTWLYHADLMGLVAGGAARVPHRAWNIRVSNLDMEHYPTVSRWALAACARLSDRPDVVLVNSETAREFHVQLGYRPKRWKVIPTGFDTERFRPDTARRQQFRQTLGRPDDYLIGLVARYDPMKDHSTFLRAAERFSRVQPDAHFVLAGPGIDAANTELSVRLAESRLHDRVTLLGQRADMDHVFPGLDVITLSSAFGEAFSNAIGEGMACGVPPVVTDVGDMAAIVGTTGRVVPPRDPGRLAAAWEELYRMGSDARTDLGSAARERIRNDFSLDAIVAEYERTYRELVMH